MNRYLEYDSEEVGLERNKEAIVCLQNYLLSFDLEEKEKIELLCLICALKETGNKRAEKEASLAVRKIEEEMSRDIDFDAPPPVGPEIEPSVTFDIDFIKRQLFARLPEGENLTFGDIELHKAIIKLAKIHGFLDENASGKSSVIYKGANISKQTYSRLISTDKKNSARNYASREVLIALSIALRATKQETIDLLKIKNYAFNDSQRDKIIIAYLEMRDELSEDERDGLGVRMLDDILYELNLETISKNGSEGELGFSQMIYEVAERNGFLSGKELDFDRISQKSGVDRPRLERLIKYGDLRKIVDKDTMLSICVALKTTYKEARRLLDYQGHTFDKSKRDSTIKKLFGMAELESLEGLNKFLRGLDISPLSV